MTPAVAAAATGSQTTPLLRVANVGVRFGGIVALERVSFDLEAGQMLGLIGPNGAGKTTLFNCFSRLYTPVEGDILFEGASILDKSPHRMVEIGIGRTFQNLALFARMSVLDNVRVGGHHVARSDFLSDALHLPWVRRQDHALDEIAWSRTARSPTCRSDCRSGSSWRARSRSNPSSCCSTNRPAGSITSKWTGSAASSAASATSATSRCSWSSIT